jgi:arginyl-tRNA synthetase
VTLQERGESFYNPQLPGVVEELAGLGIVEESEGAQVVWTDDDRKNVPPLMVQKGDGGFGYARCCSTAAFPTALQSSWQRSAPLHLVNLAFMHRL